MHPRRHCVQLFAVRKTKPYNDQDSTRGTDILIVLFEIDSELTI